MAMASRSRCNICASGSIQATNEGTLRAPARHGVFLSIPSIHLLSTRSSPPPFSPIHAAPFLGFLVFVRVVTTYRFLISDLIDLSSPALGSRFPIYVMATSLTIPARSPSLIGSTINFPPSPLLGDFQIASRRSSVHFKKTGKATSAMRHLDYHIKPQSLRLDLRIIPYMNTILGLALLVIIPPFFFPISFPIYTDVDHTLSTA